MQQISSIFQVYKIPTLFEVSQFCCDLLQLPLRCSSLIGQSAKTLVSFSLTLAGRCLATNIGSSSLTHHVLKLGRIYPEVIFLSSFFESRFAEI